MVTVSSYISFLNNDKFSKRIKKITGYKPGNIQLYKLALTHKTTASKIHNGELKEDNERLEYLGDAVLDLIVSDLLFKRFPYKSEGFLTEMRSKIVSRDQLGAIAYKMGLQEIIKMNKNLMYRKGSVRVIGGNALEALIGAFYLDKGYNKTVKFIKKRIIDAFLDLKELEESELSYKGKLLEYAQKIKTEVKFDTIKEFKLAGETYFEICVIIDEVNYATGTFNSKKKAEELASEKAYKKLLEQESISN